MSLDETELPEGWACATLRDVITELQSGSRPPGGVRHIAEGVPSIGGEHLNDAGGFRFESIKYVPVEFYNRMSRGRIQVGDVLVVKDGATTGKVSLIRQDFPHWPAVVNEHVFICRPTEAAYPPFLFYYLFSEDGQTSILENFRGSAQGGINQEFAPSTKVILAPLAEQKRIVEKVESLLASVNATRERLAKVPAILKRLRQAVLAAACSGRLTADWRDDRNLWQETDLGTLLAEKPKNGYSAKPVNYTTPYRVLTLTATTSGKFDSRYYKYFDEAIPENSVFWLEPGDILVQRGNTIEYVGVSAIYDGPPKEFIYPDLMIRLRAKKGVSTSFLHYALSDEQARNYLRDRAVGIAGSMPKINQPVLVGLPVNLPPLEEQQEIVRRVEALFQLADAIEERVQAARLRADTLTQAVLARAFRGELVPTEAELARQESREYEPASALLARIHAERAAAPAARASRSRKIVGQTDLHL